MTKVLLTADWHFSNSLPHAKPLENGLTDRLEVQAKVLRSIGGIAREHHVDSIFVLGDVFDKHLVDAVTLRQAMTSVVKLAKDCTVCILAGNHESGSKTHGGRYLPEVFAEIGDPGIIYLGTNSCVSMDNIRFWGVPWFPMSQYREQLAITKEKAKSKKTIRVLLTHQSIVGCKSGGWTCDDGIGADELEDGWDFVFSGHFHDYQKFGKHGAYVGSPMQHHFGDAGSVERGVLILDFKDGTRKKLASIKPEFVPIESPRFHVINWEPGALDDQDKFIQSGDYVRVDIECTDAELPEHDKSVSEWAEKRQDVHLRPVHKPVYQHEDRLQLEGPVSNEEVVSKYLDMAQTDGYDVEKLREIGLATLQEVSDETRL